MQLVAVYYLACATLATATLVLLSLAVFTDSWDVASVSGLQPGLANLTGDWRLVEVVEGRLDILYRDGVVTSHDLWVNNPSVWAATKVDILQICSFDTLHNTRTLLGFRLQTVVQTTCRGCGLEESQEQNARLI